MAYSTIFKIKPKKENKIDFCLRLCKLLNDIIFISDGNYIKGKEMLDVMFRYSSLNNGYYDIDDILNEANCFNNIFTLSGALDCDIHEEEILANIDIIINCFHSFEHNEYRNRRYDDVQEAKEVELILFDAIREYLLSFGYKIMATDEKLHIVESGISIDVENIENAKIKNDIASFYDYKNEKDIDEKKKIILNVIGKLESKKNDIKNIFGIKIADTISSYANNINLRHNNCDVNYKKYYNKAVADLSEKELIDWYNYIFAFVLNIYIKLDELKNINIDNGYK